MLQQDTPGDYVIATGISRSVRDLVNTAFACVDLEPDDYLAVDEALVRARDPVVLVGDAAKAYRDLGWAPRTSFEAMIEAMVEADLQSLGRSPASGPAAGATATRRQRNPTAG
jgi:GDPmannose 4,6-dehydratase